MGRYNLNWLIAMLILFLIAIVLIGVERGGW